MNYTEKCVINAFCVPKKELDTGEMSKLPVVRHGSYSTRDATSRNDWMDEQKFKLPTINLLHDANNMSLRDLKDAFRQIPLAKKDVDHLRCSVFGLKFICVKQPHGISSATANCQSFAQIIT